MQSEAPLLLCVECQFKHGTCGVSHLTCTNNKDMNVGFDGWDHVGIVVELILDDWRVRSNLGMLHNISSGLEINRAETDGD